MALRAICQIMDWDVTNRIVYGPKRSRCQFTIVWMTDRSINSHLSRSAMNYLLYYTQYLQSWQTTFFLLLYIYDQNKNEFGHNPVENIIMTGPNLNFPKQQVSLNQFDSGDINDFDHNEFE